MSIGGPKSSWSRPAAGPAVEIAKRHPSISTLVILLRLLVKQAAVQSAAFATIAGRVLHLNAESVARATITAIKMERGMVRKTITTEDGLYQFDHLTPGIYDIRVEAGSFTGAEAKSLKLQFGEQRDVNFSLLPAGRTESVLVVSETTLPETTKTDARVPTANEFPRASYVAARNFKGLGGPSGEVTPRIIQLAVRFSW